MATILDQQLFHECLDFMDKMKQGHLKTISRQISKFDRLQQKQGGICNWPNYHVQLTRPINYNRALSHNRENNMNKNHTTNMADITKKLDDTLVKYPHLQMLKHHFWPGDLNL